MKCPICGGPNFQRREGLYHFTESGLDWVYLEGVRHGRCESCDDDVVELPNPEQLFELIAKTIIEQERPLHAKEIRFLRSLIGWSQENLGAAMGLGRVAIARWEAGSSHPPLQMDMLLRPVWLKAYLRQSQERCCGILKDEDLARLGELIGVLGEVIEKMRKAVPGPAPFSINVKTHKVEVVEC